jgi:galactose-1-phosphate uridylyltransferase
MIECVVKTALDSDNSIQWQGLYVDGKKVLESYSLDIDIAVSIFAPDREYQHVYVYENDFSSISQSFPDEEDFTYLLDGTEVRVGSRIWLENGSHEVVEIRPTYRVAGNYSYTNWESGVAVKTDTYYLGHDITEFRVSGSSKFLVWEDYNYQQSNLYELHKRKTSKTKKRA